MGEQVEPNCGDRAAVIEYHVAEERVRAGTLSLDEVRGWELVARTIDRTADLVAGILGACLVPVAGVGHEPRSRQRLGGIVPGDSAYAR